MKGKTILIVLIAVLATAASVFVGTRAVTSSVGETRDVAARVEAQPGEIETQVSEMADLAEDLENAKSTSPVEKGDRDPMQKYTRPAPPPAATAAKPTEPPKPTFPSYKVTAVLVGDQDPRAFMAYKGSSFSLKEGDELEGGYVVLKIESDGVTVQGEAGTKKYPFPS
jgi:type IV pilus biogenesis protein PilP